MVSARWWTLAVWALAAASAVFWGLRIFVQPPQAPPHTRTADTATALRGDLARLLGADAAPATAAANAAAEPAADARFQLVGVVSPRSPRAAAEGVAVIAIDGKPPRAFRVGAVVEGQNVLQAVDARGATLGPAAGAALVALKLAPPAPAATGTPAPPAAAAVPTRLPATVPSPRRGGPLPASPPAVPQPPPPVDGAAHAEGQQPPVPTPSPSSAQRM